MRKGGRGTSAGEAKGKLLHRELSMVVKVIGNSA